jgi:hypothetical protein
MAPLKSNPIFNCEIEKKFFMIKTNLSGNLLPYIEMSGETLLATLEDMPSANAERLPQTQFEDLREPLLATLEDMPSANAERLPQAAFEDLREPLLAMLEDMPSANAERLPQAAFEDLREPLLATLEDMPDEILLNIVEHFHHIREIEWATINIIIKNPFWFLFHRRYIKSKTRRAVTVYKRGDLAAAKNLRLVSSKFARILHPCYINKYIGGDLCKSFHRNQMLVTHHLTKRYLLTPEFVRHHYWAYLLNHIINFEIVSKYGLFQFPI